LTASVQLFQVGVDATHVHKGAIVGESFIEPPRSHRMAVGIERQPRSVLVHTNAVRPQDSTRFGDGLMYCWGQVLHSCMLVEKLTMRFLPLKCTGGLSVQAKGVEPLTCFEERLRARTEGGSVWAAISRAPRARARGASFRQASRTRRGRVSLRTRKEGRVRLGGWATWATRPTETGRDEEAAAESVPTVMQALS
jgi:hypothetical protein